MTFNAIIVSLLFLIMVVGFGMLCYGTFKTPIPYTYKTDLPFFKIRKNGAVLFIGAMIAVAVFLQYVVK